MTMCDKAVRCIAWQKVSAALMLTLAVPSALALGLAHDAWFVEPAGQVSDGGRGLSLTRDLGLSNEYSPGWRLEAGWLLLALAPLDFSGSETLQQEANFGGATFSSDSEVSTRVNLDDYTLQALWRPWPALGLGGRLKVIDGDVRVTEVSEDGGLLGLPLLPGGGDGEPNSSRRSVSEVFPMLTVEVVTALMPLFDWQLLASYARFDDDEVLELETAIVLDGSGDGPGLSFALGWQQKRYDVTDGSFNLDARADGLFARLRLDL